MKKNPCAFITIAGCLLFLASCGASRVIPGSQLNLDQDYCSPSVVYAPAPAISQPDADSLMAQDSLMNRTFSAHQLLMARATGTLDLIHRIITCRNDTSLQGRIHLTELNNQVQQRLMLFRTELDGLAAELDCQGERSDQLAGYLDNINAKRNSGLIIGSIILGSVTTVVAVLVKKTDVQNGVTIAGGLATAGLSAWTIHPAGKKIQWEHPRNVLEDIWLAPEHSGVYPSSVWAILTDTHFTNSGELTLVESIKQRWLAFEFDGHIDPAETGLQFGKGGAYSAEELHTRSNMLNQLQSTIRSVNQDLQGLLLAIEACLR